MHAGQSAPADGARWRLALDAAAALVAVRTAIGVTLPAHTADPRHAQCFASLCEHDVTDALQEQLISRMVAAIRSAAQRGDSLALRALWLPCAEAVMCSLPCRAQLLRAWLTETPGGGEQCGALCEAVAEVAAGGGFGRSGGAGDAQWWQGCECALRVSAHARSFVQPSH